MPRRQWGSPLTDAAGAIGSALVERSNRLRQEKSDKDELEAWARSVDLATNFPDVYREVQTGKIKNVGVAANAINQRQEKEKSDRAKQDQKIKDLSEKTLGLANVRAGSSDPTAPRQNLDLPQFRAMPAGAPAPKVPGGVEIPDQGVVSQIEDVQSAYPGISKTERLDPVRARMRPGDEGLAGVAGRSIGAAKSRDEERIKKLQDQTLGIVGQGKTPLSPQQVGQGGGTFEQSLKYGGMTGEEMQRRAREGQPSEGPKWSKEDQQVVRVLGQQGIKEDSPEFPQAFLDAKKRGGVTATQERADAKELAFAEIEQRSYQDAPQHMLTDDFMKAAREGVDLKKENEKARKRWILDQRINWMESNVRTGDPLAAEMKELLAMKARLLEDYEGLLAE